MMSKPALRWRLGTAIMYSSVWEYTDTNFVHSLLKKALHIKGTKYMFFQIFHSNSPVQCHKHRERREADRMKRESQDQGEQLKPLKYTGKA